MNTVKTSGRDNRVKRVLVPPSCKVKNNEKIEEQKKVSTIFTHQTPAQSRREESEEIEEYEESGETTACD